MKIHILNGSFRKVFVFSNIAIKIPHSFKGWLCNINEVHIYKTHHRKDLLCPILFSDPFRLCIIMRRVEPLYEFTDAEDKLIKDVFLEDDVLLNDIKENNFGYLNGKMVKIDYGRDFWLHNVWIDIKNKFKRRINNV